MPEIPGSGEPGWLYYAPDAEYFWNHGITKESSIGTVSARDGMVASLYSPGTDPLGYGVYEVRFDRPAAGFDLSPSRINLELKQFWGYLAGQGAGYDTSQIILSMYWSLTTTSSPSVDDWNLFGTFYGPGGRAAGDTFISNHWDESALPDAAAIHFRFVITGVPSQNTWNADSIWLAVKDTASPTRLFPRDDALGNTPRIHPPPRSIQSGNRLDTYY